MHNEDGITALIAAMVLTTAKDYRNGYTHAERLDAAMFRRSAGLHDEAA